jgi:regulator of replication initiation timing
MNNILLEDDDDYFNSARRSLTLQRSLEERLKLQKEIRTPADENVYLKKENKELEQRLSIINRKLNYTNDLPNKVINQNKQIDALRKEKFHLKKIYLEKMQMLSRKKMSFDF